MTHQTFKQWQQNPIQGAIPLTMAKALQKANIYDALATAKPCLQAAHDVAAAMSLNTSHHDLFVAICDALNGCNEALERVADAPDELYDVAQQQQPINGKLHSPEEAFAAIDLANDPDFEF